ncbi:class I SAM-dependent methyltransferase [bacterium]|nr:class I SAM-dependent methyltransferase [bacterium]
MSNGLIISFLLLFVFILAGWTLSLITSIVLTPSIHTPKEILPEILAIMKLNKDDHLYDLGSGDGRVIIAARKYMKLKGYGYDISPIIVSLSKVIKLLNLGINTDVFFDLENIFEVKLKKATKVYTYQNPKILQILDKKFKRELENVKVYSYRYEIPEKKSSKKHKLGNGMILFEYKY